MHPAASPAWIGVSNLSEVTHQPKALHWLALGVAALVVVIDQITKTLALHALVNHAVQLVGPFSFALAYNPGSSFSLLQGSTGPLMVIEVLFIGLLGFLGMRSSHRWTQVALGLMLGGAIGNFVDRVFRDHHGSVIDFIASTFWPTFNVADACITVGAVIMVVVLVMDLVRGDTTRDA